MRKQILVLLLTMIYGGTVYAQTTAEEYLYATFGYNEQLDKGLDDKKGYSWKALTDYKFVNNKGTLMWKKSQVSKFEFEGLYRDGESAPCAIVVIYKEDEDMKKKDGVFICIPHPDSGQEILAKAEKYFREEIDLDADVTTYYSLALSKLAIYLAQCEH